MAKLKAVIEILQIPAPLPFENKDHKLTNYGKKKEAFRDCHIESDWVLIYLQTDVDLILTRTGTHSDLFK